MKYHKHVSIQCHLMPRIKEIPKLIHLLSNICRKLVSNEVGIDHFRNSNLILHVGLIDFIDDSWETVSDIFNNAIKIIDDYQLNINNLTSIGADNANVNFGQYHSVFKLFKDRLRNIHKGRHKCLLYKDLNSSSFNHVIIPFIFG